MRESWKVRGEFDRSLRARQCAAYLNPGTIQGDQTDSNSSSKMGACFSSARTGSNTSRPITTLRARRRRGLRKAGGGLGSHTTGRPVGSWCGHEASAPSLISLEKSDARSLQNHRSGGDVRPMARCVDHRIRRPIATVEVSPLDAAMSLEVEAIADALLDATSARKVGVFRQTHLRDAEVVGVILACEGDRRTARQNERGEEDR
jgi:hypothetical protein